MKELQRESSLIAASICRHLAQVDGNLIENEVELESVDVLWLVV